MVRTSNTGMSGSRLRTTSRSTGASVAASCAFDSTTSDISGTRVLPEGQVDEVHQGLGDPEHLGRPGDADDLDQRAGAVPTWKRLPTASPLGQ